MTTPSEDRKRTSRVGAQDGFVMVVAVSVIFITSLLLAGLFALTRSDASLSRGDLDAKRAYAAAQAGAQYYLGQLNQNAANSSWWQTCANDTSGGQRIAIPGTTGETYSYRPVVDTCAKTGAIGSVLDPNTGLLRMEFTGYAGQYGRQRTIVADFRPITPLSYLWFTGRETVDPNANGNCNGNKYSPRASAPSNGLCWLTWGSSDKVNGPMYTQDQFYIASSSSGATFGRNSQDVVASSGGQASVCVTGNGSAVPSTNPCPSSINVKGSQKPGAQFIPLPSDNLTLAKDADVHGIKLREGTTTLKLNLNFNGQTVIESGVTCTTASSSSCSALDANNRPLKDANLSQFPIVYAPSSTTTTCNRAYDPTNVSYATVNSGAQLGTFTGGCGDLYVSGKYSSSLTLAADNDIVVNGKLTNNTDSSGTTMPSGSATLGLVATQYVRVYHGVSYDSNGNCSGPASPVTLDAAVLALNHSFVVDNYDCGSPSTLTVHGSIAQQYRGPVARIGGSNGGASTGYNKSYTYDNRLQYTLPAYLFDLQNTSWNVVRETQCAPNLANTDPQSCLYTGDSG